MKGIGIFFYVMTGLILLDWAWNTLLLDNDMLILIILAFVTGIIGAVFTNMADKKKKED